MIVTLRSMASRLAPPRHQVEVRLPHPRRIERLNRTTTPAGTPSTGPRRFAAPHQAASRATPSPGGAQAPKPIAHTTHRGVWVLRQAGPPAGTRRGGEPNHRAE